MSFILQKLISFPVGIPRGSSSRETLKLALNFTSATFLFQPAEPFQKCIICNWMLLLLLPRGISSPSGCRSSSTKLNGTLHRHRFCKYSRGIPHSTEEKLKGGQIKKAPNFAHLLSSDGARCSLLMTPQYRSGETD